MCEARTYIGCQNVCHTTKVLVAHILVVEERRAKGRGKGGE